MKKTSENKAAFTLIELLVVIAIIGLLSTISIIALSQARIKARNARRLADMHQIQNALSLYYQTNNSYPTRDFNDCGNGWDMGNTQYQFLTGKLPGIMEDPPNDSKVSGCNGYAYYKYPAGTSGCDSTKGAFYVLGIRGTGQSYPDSPGWECPSRDWSSEFEWVTGAFEK